VHYDKDACIGCRYCITACPFDVPQFDYASPFPEIHKCQLCDHLWAEGGFSACADACPTGATLFGPVDQLEEEVARRQALPPGTLTAFPRRSTETGESTRVRPVASYVDHVYGEREGGGTQVLMMSGVAFDKLGLPELPEHSYASVSETIQHSLYQGLTLPFLALTGLVYASYRTLGQRRGENERPKAPATPVRPGTAPEHAHAPLGGRVVTPLTVFLGLLALVAAVIVGVRLFYGIGAVSNLNNGYGWGLWIAVDVVIGTALGCGGYAMALLVYIFNRGHYHPLVRPALLGSLFGYTLGATAVIVDLGRWWNAWHIVWPSYAQPNSVMFEVAVCITAYVLVMWIEFTPAFLERLGWRNLQAKLNKVLFAFIALGVLLPTMHQSSLGTMLVIYGHRLHELWQTTSLPLLFLISAVSMGFSVVIFEATLAGEGFKRPRETHILERLAVVLVWALGLFLVARFADLVWRDSLGSVLSGDFLSRMFLAETILFALPMLILAHPANRRSARLLFVAAVLMLLGGSLYRIDAFLVAFNPGDQYSYFPSLPEMLITVGIFAFEILAYIVFVRVFPVLPKVEPKTVGVGD
jgi:Ni/Fe-hydrogenase subunit HybB-like protein/ferredoxin